MTPQDFLNKVVHVQQWQQNGKRAAHKPLLMLYALGEVMSKDSSQFHAYSDVDPKLQDLLLNWGEPISSGLPRTHEPFARLKRDGIWELKDSTGRVIPRPTHPSRKHLRDAGIVGGFPNEIHEMLRRNHGLALEAARRILAKNWPASLHLADRRCGGNFTGRQCGRDRRTS